MYLVKETLLFSKWLSKLKDIRGKVSIIRRVDRMKQGNFGDHKSLGENLSELRITVGAGYRVYFTKYDEEIIVLLVGGDKSTQINDIIKAKNMVKEYSNE